jgi:hypothetical protein
MVSSNQQGLRAQFIKYFHVSNKLISLDFSFLSPYIPDKQLKISAILQAGDSHSGLAKLVGADALSLIRTHSVYASLLTPLNQSSASDVSRCAPGVAHRQHDMSNAAPMAPGLTITDSRHIIDGAVNIHL